MKQAYLERCRQQVGQLARGYMEAYLQSRQFSVASNTGICRNNEHLVEFKSELKLLKTRLSYVSWPTLFTINSADGFNIKELLLSTRYSKCNSHLAVPSWIL